MPSLTDRVVIVTGASAGIGAATARTLVSAGARVVLGARREQRLTSIVDELGEDKAVAVQVDVREPSDAQRLVKAALDQFGRVDALVANAGIGMYGGILDGTDDEVRAIMDTNYPGTVWPVREVVRHFLDTGVEGDLVIVSSVAGMRGDANEAVYAGTKFAQLGLAGSLDRELREKGIRVSSICPASVDTEFALARGRTPGDPAAASWLRPDDVAECIRVVLEQPRSVRTTLWAIWPMSEDS
jgi:3-oxoacyl-[acyl-carrier protein] reductase